MTKLKYIKEINNFFLDYNENTSILVSILKRECNIDSISFKVFLTDSQLKLQQEDNEKREQYVKQYLSNKHKYNGMFYPILQSNKFLYKYNANDSTQMIWTSQSQLLFFKWALESKLFGLVSKYANEINEIIYGSDIRDMDDLLDKFSDEPCLDNIINNDTQYDLSCMTNCAADDPTVDVTLHI